MSASASLECYAEQVNAVTSLNRVWHELMHFVEPLGINALAYYHKAPPGAADYSDKYFKAIGFDEELAKDHRRNHKTWVARGKSNAVIADIVGISQHTVNGYLRRVYLKTQTSDRTTAALRAIGDSLIDY